MIRNIPEIKLYGEKGCLKTHYYQVLLDDIGLPYKFMDVIENDDYAEELRNLYSNHKLNFPTITIGQKKLRNPYKDELLKWMHKLIPSMLEIQHNKDLKKFTLDINGEEAKIEYVIKNDKMYLVHSEVPHNLRGRGIGKELVLKTFEKLTAEGYKAVAVCSYIKAVKNRSNHWKNIIE
ncbi:N-acetyltransferase [Aquimarina sediminis]|uniref:N-acetyltransferase n=1 Tax=Aquimarina sediminis TaxID=2070536 RepID=UPI001F4DA97E|nr:N-acetyltransferase [Aquimarina sediminis]